MRSRQKQTQELVLLLRILTKTMSLKKANTIKQGHTYIDKTEGKAGNY